MNTTEELQSQVNQLQQELEQRDLLVQQLSEELFRLVKGNSAFMPSQELLDHHHAEIKYLTEKLSAADDQIAEARQLLEERDNEIIDLRQEVQDMGDRTRMLEQVVAELPNVYKAKFAERMIPIKQKVESLQKENRQLHIELQSLSFRLASRIRPSRLELPHVTAS
jgi:chromosome segregation ATPase